MVRNIHAIKIWHQLLKCLITLTTLMRYHTAYGSRPLTSSYPNFYTVNSTQNTISSYLRTRDLPCASNRSCSIYHICQGLLCRSLSRHSGDHMLDICP